MLVQLPPPLHADRSYVPSMVTPSYDPLMVPSAATSPTAFTSPKLVPNVMAIVGSRIVMPGEKRRDKGGGEGE